MSNQAGRAGVAPSLELEKCDRCGMNVDAPDEHEGDWITCPDPGCPYKPVEDPDQPNISTGGREVDAIYAAVVAEQELLEDGQADALAPWLEAVTRQMR